MGGLLLWFGLGGAARQTGVGDGAVWSGRIVDDHDWRGGRLALRIVAEKRTGPFRGCRSDHFPHCASALAVVEGLVPTLAEAEAAGRRLRMVVWRVCCRVSRGKY